MAMLAEVRRRQKFSSDPRGLNWSSDDSKFGQKLMEKYGWSKGSGLGANEDGRTEHIKIQAKMDSRGVGCSKKHDDNWIAHQDDFNSLLASLNSQSTDGDTKQTESADVVQVLSLEQKSKKSKRVHYGKFTRGKDLSRAGSQDMDCIFGRRKSKSAPDTPQDVSENSSETEESGENGESKSVEHGVTTISTGTSVQAYFAKKMAELQKARAAAAGNSSPKPKEEDEKTKDLPSESMENPQWNLPENDATVENSLDVSKKKKKSKKRKHQEMEEEVAENDTEECTVENSQETENEEKKKKKKKKSKKRKQDLEDLESSDSPVPNISAGDAEELCDSTPDTEHQENLQSAKKKKKSKKRKDVDEIDSNLGTDAKQESSQKLDNDLKQSEGADKFEKTESVRVKKKAKSNGSVSETNQVVEESFRGSNIGSIEGYGGGVKLRQSKSAKKKKKSKARK